MNCDGFNTKGLHKYQWIVNPVSNQNGSVIVIALLILVAMTLGGITATQRSVTESFTVRNTAIHKQNLQFAEMAAMEGAGRIIIEDTAPVWLHALGHDVDNPVNIETLEAVETGTMNALLQRRGNQDLEFYAIIGVGETGGPPVIGSIASDRVVVRIMVIGVYESDNYGRKTVEVGIRKRYRID